ncbi:flagellar brake protein [Jeotgalibacillus haloalkalitolerans]|uniref:Flagellar brake domain-containing protein n=1 Tax=Jeotgalibacillus haloalkalitolerans TaxID=3104292 RepID=A0ABU5KL97_9BACL|nr:flagellar brake domain-containing protein [Jeotgalibacillus sp. HH7-29]MDZ5712028.1 flagellar brake domain-containing protein [Jeotgalibacillus sp. HH7-29]
MKIGTVLTIEPMHASQNDKYKSRLVEVSGGKLYIDYPINMTTNKTVFLIDGMQLRISYTNENNDAYSFETEVKGRKNANIPMILLDKPGEKDLIKVQRRQFVRVNTSIDVALRTGAAKYHTVTEDISAGGLSFIMKNGMSIKKGDLIELFLVLPMRNGETQYLKVSGEITRTKMIDRVEIGMVKFKDLTALERQLLLRYTFECQLKMKEK